MFFLSGGALRRGVHAQDKNDHNKMIFSRRTAGAPWMN
jgi:hypothetical protein